MARRVCNDIQDPQCEMAIGWVQEGMNLIWTAANVLGSAGVNGQAQTVDISGNVRRSLPATDFGSEMEEVLRKSGYSFAAAESVDVSGPQFNKRGSVPRLTHRSIFRELSYRNGSCADVALNHFDNGDLILDHAGGLHTFGTGNDDNTLGLKKRFDGAGFKIAFSGRSGGDIVTPEHRDQISDAIAHDWAYSALNTDMNEYFGLVKHGGISDIYQATFYFRIIPETQGFGLDYESVDACGGMGDFL